MKLNILAVIAVAGLLAAGTTFYVRAFAVNGGGTSASRLSDWLDPAATGAGRGFRVVILPGAAALWPLLLSRCVRKDFGQ